MPFQFTCEHCGAEVLRPGTKRSRARYCSLACKAAGQSTNARLRFRRKVHVRGADECWPWLGGRSGGRYGKFSLAPKVSIGAHVFAWEHWRGHVPVGMEVCHTCDNPICCNPCHLFLGTSDDNSKDMVKKGRQAAGVSHGRAKLTTEQIREVRLNRHIRTRAYADAFGVSMSTIQRVRSGETY
jgi:hypothetical protein